jgi:hypothetical protein
VHTTYEDKSGDVKDSFDEELGHVCDQFPRYNMTILLGDFNAKVGMEVAFKLTIGNESLHDFMKCKMQLLMIKLVLFIA